MLLLQLVHAGRKRKSRVSTFIDDEAVESGNELQGRPMEYSATESEGDRDFIVDDAAQEQGAEWYSTVVFDSDGDEDALIAQLQHRYAVAEAEAGVQAAVHRPYKRRRVGNTTDTHLNGAFHDDVPAVCDSENGEANEVGDNAAGDGEDAHVNDNAAPIETPSKLSGLFRFRFRF